LWAQLDRVFIFDPGFTVALQFMGKRYVKRQLYVAEDEHLGANGCELCGMSQSMKSAPPLYEENEIMPDLKQRRCQGPRLSFPHHKRDKRW